MAHSLLIPLQAACTEPPFAPALPFNANAAGEYGLMLRVRDQADADVTTSAILVQVPEPGSVALVGVAVLAALGISRRRQG